MRRQKINLRWMAFFAVAVVALSGCGKGCGSKGGGTSQGALELIPAQSNVVVSLNWKKLMASPLGPKLQEGIPADMKAFTQDIDGMTVGLNVKGPSQDPDFVTVISSKIDSAKVIDQITEEAKKEGGSLNTEDYEGVKIYSSTKDQNVGGALLGDKALVGKKEYLKKAIDLSKGKGDSVQKNKAVSDLIGGVDKGKMVWAVGTIPPGVIPSGGDAGGPGNPMAALSSLKAVDLAIDYTDNLTLDLGVVAGSADDDKQIETMANSYKTLFGASMAQKDPSLGKVMNGLTIAANKERVVLSLKLDKATVDDLAAKAGKSGPPGMGAMGDTPPGGAAPGMAPGMAPSDAGMPPAAPAAPAMPPSAPAMPPAAPPSGAAPSAPSAP